MRGLKYCRTLEGPQCSLGRMDREKELGGGASSGSDVHPTLLKTSCGEECCRGPRAQSIWRQEGSVNPGQPRAGECGRSVLNVCVLEGEGVTERRAGEVSGARPQEPCEGIWSRDLGFLFDAAESH